jgi:hypothetical protein
MRSMGEVRGGGVLAVASRPLTFPIPAEWVPLLSPGGERTIFSAAAPHV